jgi:hypothetical protein
MNLGRDSALRQIHAALAGVDLAGSSTAKFKRLEVCIARLVGIETNGVVAATITRAGNFAMRATQSKRAQEAALFVGVLSDPRELDATRTAARQTVASGLVSAALLIVRGSNASWSAPWGCEGSEGESILRTAVAGIGGDVERVEQAVPRLKDVRKIYNRGPGTFRQAADIIAIANRREVVERFRSMLYDDAFFERVRVASNSRPEGVWQKFLEKNPWILGIGLAGQLLTSWSSARLEQVVAGFSVAGEGKRTDALLRTTGGIRSLVFAEIKHHKTLLLDKNEYRSGCWGPSTELAGGVVQVQQTVELASRQIGAALPDLDEDGAETGEATYLMRPRSFLILGNLSQLRGAAGGVHRGKLRSFELYRRNLYEPEILTYDELLARAEWHVELAESERTLPTLGV